VIRDILETLAPTAAAVVVVALFAVGAGRRRLRQLMR